MVGRSDLCDVRVPKGPKHVLIRKGPTGSDVRNVSGWTKMKVNGNVTKKASLKDGDIIESAGLKMTFVDDLG